MNKISGFLTRMVVIGCFITGTATVGRAGETVAESSITEVTVYPGSARVTRKVALDLSAGEHSVILDNIVPRLDENSLTVSGKGQASVKIFGAYIKREHTKEKVDKRVDELEALIESLSDQIRAENDRLDVLKKERKYLDSINLFSAEQTPKDLVTSMPPAEKLESIRSFLFEKYSDVEKRKQETDIKIRDLNRELQLAKRKINELRSFGSEQQLKFVVDLECTKPGSFALEVSYLVYGAHWRSVYDARAHYDASEVELISFAMIKQTTGEDWENVDLILSTAQPSVSGTLPYVSPWILQPYEPRPMAKATRMETFRASDTVSALGQSAAYMKESSDMPAAPEEEANLAYSQAEQKGVSITYKIARPVTLKSDGMESKYPVSMQTLKAEFEYSTYPRAVGSAYLGSLVTNSKDLQLLAGEVNLFLDEDYVGKSNIKNIGPGEEFNLYLGVDENVKVKREQISKKMDDVLLGGIKAPNRKTEFEYKLTVENYKNKDITVHLFEAIPVSQDERIKVKLGKSDPKPTDTDWEDRKGVWRWEFGLKSKAKKEITYSFVVDHPRDMNIPGI